MTEDWVKLPGEGGFVLADVGKRRLATKFKKFLERVDAPTAELTQLSTPLMHRPAPEPESKPYSKSSSSPSFAVASESASCSPRKDGVVPVGSEEQKQVQEQAQEIEKRPTCQSPKATMPPSSNRKKKTKTKTKKTTPIPDAPSKGNGDNPTKISTAPVLSNSSPARPDKHPADEPLQEIDDDPRRYPSSLVAGELPRAPLVLRRQRHLWSQAGLACSQGPRVCSEAACSHVANGISRASRNAWALGNRNL